MAQELDAKAHTVARAFDTQQLEKISVSAGVRGCQVILAVDALMRCARAQFAQLCRG